MVISFLILFGYQYLFVGFGPQGEVGQQTQETTPQQRPPATTPVPEKASTLPPIETGLPPVQAVLEKPEATADTVQPAKRPAKDIHVETDLYSAVLSEDGGIVKSFILKKHREKVDVGSAGKQLIQTDAGQGFPLRFSWGSLGGGELVYTASSETVSFDKGNKGGLRMVARSENGLAIERFYEFDRESYLFQLTVRVKNLSDHSLQGTPYLHQVNSPIEGAGGATNRFLFNGPATYVNAALKEVKPKDFEAGPMNVQGPLQWVAYEGTYFMCAVVPGEGLGQTVTLAGNGELVRMRIAGALDTLQPGGEKQYHYSIYYGPKKVSLLKETGYNLDKSINFGWFDVIARPTLALLNFFYKYVKNYGIAIILVTVIFKGVFWPITQKGLKSMKNMQKLQPKMAKIKEKYKSDPTKMNQEVMNLYKTYKVNPLGGCLPMVLQIPVFFALYKVLLQCIELRHAPFMLWITDLSAPDRLWMGLNLPYLGGIPVLTLLMGASMFLQQKMTPNTADPTQAKVMMFLPIVFTFMFLNFASGLVLYWFINNLLAILQQQLINRGAKKTA